MTLPILSFAAGVGITHTFAELNWFILSLCLVFFILFAIVFRRKPKWQKTSIYFICFIVGILWATAYAYKLLTWQLPKALESKELKITGYVDGIPSESSLRTKFIFNVTHFSEAELNTKNTVHIQLSWYGDTPVIVPGQKWQLTVRLKRPHAVYNPGGSDYSAVLFQQRIRAVGYVYSDGSNHLLGESYKRWIDRFRLRLAKRFSELLENETYLGIIQALTLGIKNTITSEQWETLRITGTAHLMAISGLHIGFIAGVGYFLGRWLWRFSGRGCLWIAAPKVGGILAILSALFYSALAGFALPTQRALIMVVTATLGLFLDRKINAWQLWSIALFVVLIFDPLSPLNSGFWLSFAAVGLLIYGMQGRVDSKNYWWKWGRAQWVVGLGLLPFTLFWFQQGSLLSFPANIIAIPWVSFLVVPFALLATVLAFVFPILAEALLYLASKMLTLLWAYLNLLESLPFHWQRSVSTIAVVVSFLGGLLLLLPKALTMRWLGILWLLPLFRVQPQTPAPGEIWYTLLDVGQGLASVVQTKNYTLIYDTGGRFSERLDSAHTVILPYLRYQGIRFVDHLIVSHEHLDHYGGAKTLLKNIPIVEISSSFPSAYADYGAAFCTAGNYWQRDKVKFTIKYPFSTQQLETLKTNDRSCVLKIDNGYHKLLLTGDIEKAAEQRLVIEYGEQLRSNLLQVPHHGSRTSSTESFLQAVDPNYAVIATGYRNRYQLPNSNVVERYKTRGINLYDSPNCGAITFKFPASEEEPLIECYRRIKKLYWHEVVD